MGLKEKRLINGLEESDIPFHKRNYKEFVGGDLDIEVNWDEWSDDHEGLLNLNGYVLQQFTDSLNQIGLDAAAKEALTDGVKTLKVTRAESAADKAIVLKDGTLELTVAPVEKWDGVIHSTDIKEYLLKAL
ncbi:MAG: hypothetical protein ACFB6R_06905 [Alphaproteobacteria bacterium]